MIAGKVLMDRNAPAALTDTAQRGYDESKALIGRWHGRGRLAYAITPRFAVTSSPAQLDAAGALKREHPDAYVQSHVSENLAEIALVQEPVSGRVVVPRRLRAPRPHGAAHDLRARRASRRGRLPFPARHADGASRTARRRTTSSGSGLFRLGRRDGRAAAGARGPRDGPGRRHQLLDAAHDAGGVRGGATVAGAARARRARCTSRRAAPRARSTSRTASAAWPSAWRPT